MSNYQPYLISDFKTGKFIGKEPWLSPPDAWPTLENMGVNKGVLEKRKGFSLFAQMKHSAVAQTTTPITGIKNHLIGGMPSLLITDNRRANYYNVVDGTMTDMSSDLGTPADIFSGLLNDFMIFKNWLGVLYMVNNRDQIHQWSGPGSAVVPFNIQVNSTDTKTNHINTCQAVYIIDDRMVLLGPTEFGEWKFNRLRYGPVLQTDFTASGGGTDDAETQGRITAHGMIGKTVYAFFDEGDKGSLWRIRRTGNAVIPFEWDRVTTTEGSRSPFSGIEFNDGLAAIGLSNILFADGTQIKPVKFLDLPNVRDILTEFNDTYTRDVFGYSQRERNERHLLWTFADSSSSAIDRILDHNVSEGNYTVHRSEQSFFVNMIGGFSGQTVPAFTELDDVLTSDGDTMANMDVDVRGVLGSTDPFTLLGMTNSKVYKWNDGVYDGTDDANGNIAINALSARFNPFNKEGSKVACEKVGFLVDNDANASFLVSMYKNTGSAAYTTKTISCDSADDTVDKFWVWIFCDGEIGNFQRVQISHTARNNRPRIHAMMPYFAKAGRLDL